MPGRSGVQRGAGSLRHRLTIQQRSTTTQDDFGQEADGWATYATRWGAVEPVSGTERFTSDRVQEEVTHTVRMRHVNGLTAEMRIRHGSRTLNIVSIGNRDERGIEDVIACKEVPGDDG